MLDSIGIKNDSSPRLWERSRNDVRDVTPGRATPGEDFSWRRTTGSSTPFMDEYFEASGLGNPNPSKEALETLWTTVKIRQATFYPQPPLKKIAAIFKLESEKIVKVSLSGSYEGTHTLDLGELPPASSAHCFVAVRVEELLKLLYPQIPSAIAHALEQTLNGHGR